MPINKDLILKLIFSFAFIGIALRVLIPVIYEYLIRKIPGNSHHDKDFDMMIRRQKERLRSQHGLYGDIVSIQSSARDEKKIHSTSNQLSPEIQKIIKESQWGGSQLVKDIQTTITKSYSYTLSDSKIQQHVVFFEKNHLFQMLNSHHQNSFDSIKNFLIATILFELLVNEARDKQFFITNSISKKLAIPPGELALAIQIKVLMILSSKKTIKDERIYSDQLLLNQYSETSIREAVETVISKESNTWAKSNSLFFEELSLALNYASMLSPIPKIQNRKDVDTACAVLGVDKNQSLEEIKKTYKKIALQKHPDKIVSQKLPIAIERKAIEKFNRIQEAMEILTEFKNKE